MNHGVLRADKSVSSDQQRDVTLHEGLAYLDPHKDIVLLGGAVSNRLSGAGSSSTRTFSSPMVNLPVVTWLLSAYDSSFLTGSLCNTEMANLTLALVYSCPG